MRALSKNVTIIPAKKNLEFNGVSGNIERHKTKVAAYCRVSTELEEQESSYEIQVEHYISYIKSKPEWEFVKIYADEGISGTNTKKREGFNEMINDAREGKIDLILTKSISRFSRNTVDCLKYTRELKESNVAVYFEKENINTLDAKGEVLMTIMAALAQQESESLSMNIKVANQYRNQQGKVTVNHNWFLGYTKDENGNLVIDEEQAEVVRRIYREYLEGYGAKQIARHLEQDGIKNGAGHTKWWDSNILAILKNEKYIGDALLQKTYTVSLLEKKRAKNIGILPQYYVEGSHDAIISRDVFLRVQAEIARRAALRERGGYRRCHSGKYALTNIVICSHCNNVYRRETWTDDDGKYNVWKCRSRGNVNAEKCPSKTIREDTLHKLIVDALNETFGKKDELKENLKENLKNAILKKNSDTRLIIERKLTELQEAIVDATDHNEEEKLENEINELKAKRDEMLKMEVNDYDLEDRIIGMLDFIEKRENKIRKYKDEYVRTLIEEIIMYDDYIEVKFKSGIQTEVKIK